MLDKLSDPRLQPFRLASGLVLFAFALAHFLNHAAALAGLDAANAVQDWRLAATQSAIGRVILPFAAALHVGLGLGKLAARRAVVMPHWEWLQIASGILVPILLIPHVVAITYFTSRTGFDYSYTSVAYLLWPADALLQSALLLVVWLHGCIGLMYWLRTKHWYGRAKYWLLATAVAVPLLALTGFLAAAREAHVQLASPDALQVARAAMHWPDATQVAAMIDVRMTSWAIYAGILTLVAAAVGIRQHAALRAPSISVAYSAGPTVRSPIGASLLEISRTQRIPHASVCGGRARCSTCRVRIDHGAEGLAPPQAAERATLARIGAAENVRLACQLRPQHDIGITRLVAPTAQPLARMGQSMADADGVEKHVAIMFLDVRGFTRLSQDRLPFDIVFLLNQLFATVGEAIRHEGGWIDKYMGDGLMAVFGRDVGLETGCRQALAAARSIDLALDGFNQRLAAEVAGGIRIGIGIHAGPVVIGRIGDADSAAVTVIGRTVNEASRLEALTKDHHCQLSLSQAVAASAGLDATIAPRQTIEVRGSDSRLEILIVKAARDLPSLEVAGAGGGGKERIRA